jgi:hypothetical protein
MAAGLAGPEPPPTPAAERPGGRGRGRRPAATEKKVGRTVSACLSSPEEGEEAADAPRQHRPHDSEEGGTCLIRVRLSYQSSYGFASGQIPRRSQGTLLPSSGEPKVSNPWNNVQRKDSI